LLPLLGADVGVEYTGKRFDLIGGRVVAGDSTKMRAQNSKKNKFNAKKHKEKIDCIDQSWMPTTKNCPAKKATDPKVPKLQPPKSHSRTHLRHRQTAMGILLYQH